jgi:hypothetical protein
MSRLGNQYKGRFEGCKAEICQCSDAWYSERIENFQCLVARGVEANRTLTEIWVIETSSQGSVCPQEFRSSSLNFLRAPAASLLFLPSSTAPRAGDLLVLLPRRRQHHQSGDVSCWYLSERFTPFGYRPFVLVNDFLPKKMLGHPP